MSKIKVRAHHGLCVRFFEQKGYSGTFTENMKRVIERLERNPLIEISEEPDLICARCPKMRESRCRNQAKVNAYDRSVLKLCGLQPGATMFWREYQERITENIMASGQFDALCGDCAWAAICHRARKNAGCRMK